MNVTTFKGLNNVADPMRLGLEWLVQADNVDITLDGGLAKRSGYLKTFTGSITGAYSTEDLRRTYLVDGGVLKALNSASVATAIRSGLSSAPMYWTEINQQVFYNNGVDSGIILPDNTVNQWRWPVPGTPTLSAVTGSLAPGQYRVCCTYLLPDGRQTGSGEASVITLAAGQALQIADIPQVAGLRTRVFIAPADSAVFQLAWSTANTSMVWNVSPDYLGADLLTYAINPLPAETDVICAWRGQIFAAQHMPQANQTVLWASMPLGYHLFDTSSVGFAVPGRVSMLAPHDDALLIGTGEAVYAYDGTKLEQITEYGVVPGWCWDKDADGTVLFWTLRGLCRALPFANLTEKQISVAPGVRAGAAVMHVGGNKRFVVGLHQGGTAFNKRI